MATNPFHDLYLSESISEDALVDLFSPIVVDYSGAMFDQGNVIIRGLQGTGKTMLLNLLRPDSRLAYRRARRDFPVAPSASQFIGAGVNLRKCGALEFAQHLEANADPRKVQELELLFADFFNYWVVADLISSVRQFVRADDPELLKEIGIRAEGGLLDDFATILAKDPCWFGAFDGISKVDEFEALIRKRIATYRRYLNLNLDELPVEITETKTIVGDPILKTAEALFNSKVLSQRTKIFVRIDQYEQLATLNVVGTQYGSHCQELIHKALAARDGRVSYRVATRTHAWPLRPTIYRTLDTLERKRDFDVIDMDELFRRRENSRTWKFPEFARDILNRRIRVSEYRTSLPADVDLSDVLDQSLKPKDRAKRYVLSIRGREDIVRRALDSLPERISDDWREYVLELSKDDFLSAWLSCAWLRQKLRSRRTRANLGKPPNKALPWEAKPYWYKERVQHGLMQIASANRQALIWSGEDDILSLSGGQILVFLFLLQHVWDAWLRDQRGQGASEFKFPIAHEVQSQGILDASIEWRNKQIEGANAKQRKGFVDVFGESVFVWLANDKAMSYPGANGFSIENNDLMEEAAIHRFLFEAVGFGDIYMAPHTSKKKGERRTKYYLAPILSPYFRIPSVHTKEPKYLSAAHILDWLSSQPRKSELHEPSAQGQLWEEKVKGD